MILVAVACEKSTNNSYFEDQLYPALNLVTVSQGSKFHPTAELIITNQFIQQSRNRLVVGIHWKVWSILALLYLL